MGKIARWVRRLLHLVTRPVRAARGRGQIVLQPYRGYGSRAEVFLIGRAFRQPGSTRPYAESLGRDLIDLGRRFLRRSIAEAPLVARFCGAEQRLETDRDGYFRVHMTPAEPPPADRLWHPMALELADHPGCEATGEVFVPPPARRYAVISDIDDTITETGVANKLVMLWRLFMQGAEGRIAFPGVAALLRALHVGTSGRELNPMLYVSRAPWGLYEVLDAFFNLHDIPGGPVFLREWGMTWESPLPRRSRGHKLELIRHMLALYDDLPFILIGDSGQRDPEIYARIVAEHPGRVLAIYIRNVSRAPERVRAIERLAQRVVAAGSTLLLAADSVAMARHAAQHGLISPRALAEVRGEKERDDLVAAEPAHEAPRPTVEQAGEPIREGGLASALEQGEASPVDVVVEAEHDAPAGQVAPRR